ncbi:hypothetical protein CGRA01v4_05532 [Colletotrichum graminicola]|nr:hypothetical protein CGRA01v4_05532 [Colletotrichum graminicola]
MHTYVTLPSSDIGHQTPCRPHLFHPTC